VNRIILLGAGGHSRVVAEIARLNGYDIIDYLDDYNPSVLGKISDFEKYVGEADFFVAIGNQAVRQRFQDRLKEKGAHLATLIHPSAVVFSDAVIGAGSVIMPGAIVTANATIGEGCILNTKSSVDHDCKIGNFVHLSVGANVCGTVTVGDRTWVGAGATIINNRSVCADCIIGAGASVIRSIEIAGTYVGVPAKKCDKNKGE